MIQITAPDSGIDKPQTGVLAAVEPMDIAELRRLEEHHIILAGRQSEEVEMNCVGSTQASEMAIYAEIQRFHNAIAICDREMAALRENSLIKGQAHGIEGASVLFERGRKEAISDLEDYGAYVDGLAKAAGLAKALNQLTYFLPEKLHWNTAITLPKTMPPLGPKTAPPPPRVPTPPPPPSSDIDRKPFSVKYAQDHGWVKAYKNWWTAPNGKYYEEVNGVVFPTD